MMGFFVVITAYCVELSPKPQILINGRTKSSENADVYCPGSQDNRQKQDEQICLDAFGTWKDDQCTFPPTVDKDKDMENLGTEQE